MNLILCASSHVMIIIPLSDRGCGTTGDMMLLVAMLSAAVAGPARAVVPAGAAGCDEQRYLAALAKTVGAASAKAQLRGGRGGCPQPTAVELPPNMRQTKLDASSGAAAVRCGAGLRGGSH